jgi:hypothetical protein
VALLDWLDAHHDAASACMARASMPLLTVAPVLSEAACFLPARLSMALASLVPRGVFQVHAPDAAGCACIAQLFDKYAHQDPDWANLELV